MRNARILIVEDESIIALDIKRSLIKLGYEVLGIADTGEVAIALARKYTPDLALMDVQLHSEMDGVTTATHLRQQFGIPVVFLTAHADDATLEYAKTAAPFGYIIKPFETCDLSTAIEVALSRFSAEQTTQQLLQRERELRELKSQFISIVSHEFRNPLSSIQFCLDLIERQESKPHPEKRHTYFQRARSAVEQMKNLLEDVLILGEIDAHGLPCHPMPLDLLHFCQELIEELQNTLNAAHTIKLVFPTLPSNAELTCHLDVKLLRHILVNLLSNAIKYSPQASAVKLEVECDSDFVTLQLQDQGIGIPASDHSRLFEPFYRAANANSISGTGLGLCVVKKCVDAHGGSILVSSEVNAGSTFRVKLRQHFSGPAAL